MLKFRWTLFRFLFGAFCGLGLVVIFTNNPFAAMFGWVAGGVFLDQLYRSKRKW